MNPESLSNGNAEPGLVSRDTITLSNAEHSPQAQLLSRNSEALRDIHSAFHDLYRAVERGDFLSCSRLLETKSIDLCETSNLEDSSLMGFREDEYEVNLPRGISLMEIACKEGFVRIAELLLSKGADIQGIGRNNLIPLWIASIYDKPDIIDLLLSKGANVHQKDVNNGGCSAIMYASLHSNIEVIQQLLSKGGNRLDETKNGRHTCFTLTFNHKVRFILRKWPFTMAVIVLRELLVYAPLFEILPDLQELIGNEDCNKDFEV